VVKLFDGKLPFSYLLMGIIFLIIITFVLAGIWLDFENSEHTIRENADRLRAMSESHIENSFRMIDTGLKLYDSTYNEQMKDAFIVVMEEYNRTGGDPARMDLERLKQRIRGMDIYVITDRCVIAYATSPSDIGLDFAVVYPDFCDYLHSIWNTSQFYPDRVVMEWFTGTLTKFSYMPAPDHRYILELGMRSDRFAQERMNLQYSDVVGEVRAFNPYIEEVLLFQKQKRLVYNMSYVPTPEESEMLDYILWENRTSQVTHDADRERTIVWQVIDLRDPDYAADMSIFAKITYNEGLLASELSQLRMFSALFAAVVLLSGGLLAVLISRKLSRPIEQLVEDIDAIAGGDLDHTVSHVSGYEFSTLERSIRMMVERLKEQLRKCEVSEKRFMELVQLLPQGIFETDLQGKLTFGNTVAFEIFGYAPPDLDQGLTIYDVLVPEDRVRARETFQSILQGKKTEGSEYTGLRRGGSTLPIMVYTAPIAQDGKVTGARGTIVDITRLKRIEAEIRQLNVELEHRVEQRTLELEDATREMEAFTYSVSHDLRAPLRAIDGYSSILLQEAGEQLNDQEWHYLEVLRQNAQKMDSLIEGLLNLSRMGRQELKREWISPEPIVQEILGELREESPEMRAEITVGELPPCYADPVMLRQVYFNLISNAVKFTRNTEQPRIVIGITADKTQTIYFVRDNGIGFDMRFVDKLFKPFQRLHETVEYEGSGIGLAVVHRIIKRHEGTIWVESTPGRGTTFFFTIGGYSGR
jgi:PAS domain S-box-containing protein